SCRDFIIDRLLLGQHINDWSWQSALIRCDYADASVDNDGDICMEPGGDVSDFSPGFSRANQSLSAMLLCYHGDRRVNCPLARVDDRRNQLSWLASSSSVMPTQSELSLLDGLRLLAGQLIGCHRPHWIGDGGSGAKVPAELLEIIGPDNSLLTLTADSEQQQPQRQQFLPDPHRLTFDLASLLLGLARPGSPLDPQLQLATLASQLAREAAESSARLRLRRLYRRHACGYGDGEDDSKANFNVDSETENEFEPPWWRQLADHVGTMLSSLASCRKDLSHRPEASPHRQQAEYERLQTEITQFATNYCRRDLLASLAGFANGDDCIDSISEQCYSAVVHQLDNWAAVTDAFANRLLTAYPALSVTSQVSHLCGAFPPTSLDAARSLERLLATGACGSKRQLLPALLRLGLLATAEPDPSARLAGAGRVLRDDLLPAFIDWQRRRLEREAQEESLYTYKEHSRLETRTTEEQFEADLRLAFPDFNDCYADLLTSTMTMTSDDEKAKSANEAKKDSEEFSDRDRLLLMCALQRAADGDRDGQLTARLADCCYRLAGDLCSDAARDGRFLDPDADPKLLASHLRALTSLIASAASSAAESAASADYPDCLLAAPLDVYRDPAPDAAAACLAPLARLSIRLGELLGQWPENVTLVQLRKLAERVMSFNVRDPLMKFVTGSGFGPGRTAALGGGGVARGVANDGAAPAVGVIIEWRRMELNRKLESCSSWKACLDHCQWRFRQSAARWLLPLAGILNDCTQPAQKCNASQLCQSLCQFLDRASLGDFSARLDCVGLLKRLSDDWLLDDQCRFVLANARAYYAQYLPAVAAAARERRAGVESQLKASFCSAFVRISSDFIKIVKWSDMNFWSVRASVDRSHRAVLKAVKQLEELLRESALSAGCFTLPESANHKSTNSDIDLSEGDERNFCHAVRKLAERIRRLAPTSAASEAAAAVTSSVSGVAELCQRIVESSRQLRDMAPEQTDSRERYERQASQIQRLKRKALSDLFKTLQQAGLSYRKGRLAALSSLDEHRCLLFSFASFHQRDCHAGQHLLRGMHRRLAMTSTLTGGACTKELGLDGIERCDGFSLHLQRLLADLCRLLSRHAASFVRLAAAAEAAAAAPVTPRRRLSLRRLEAACNSTAS
uniref:FATC domain-containing protein n=1 Tax=Macrostomum lignano TaxID=282301 RepID=A0A1I8HKZ3_9PLAT